VSWNLISEWWHWIYISTWKVTSEWVPWLYAQAKDWQTLIGGFLALIGAQMTVQAVRGQIAQAREQEAGRRRSNAQAARALLPLALSETVHYAQACMKACEQAATSGKTPQPPKLAQTYIDQIRDCVRSAEEEPAQRLANLLSWLQIQQTRLRDMSDRNSGRYEIAQGVIDAAVLHALAEGLFPYARASEEDWRPNVSAQDIARAYFIAGVDYEDDEQLVRDLNARERRAGSQGADDKGSSLGEDMR
jgi:hypothetical protein